MSPFNFSLEYRLSFVKKENHPPVVSSKSCKISSSEKDRLPITFIVFISATSPSSISIFKDTLFLGSSSLVTSTFAP